MQRRHLLSLPALLAPAIMAAPGIAHAQDGAWPGRQPIRLIAGFPAGGLADAIGRLFAAPLGQALGATMVVENRTGAAGTLGADAVAKAAPDGFTLAISHAIPFGFAQGVLPSIPYDPVADFTHLTMLAEAPTVTVVLGNSLFRSLAQMLETARTRPVRYGSSGVGSAEHIMGAVVATAAGAANYDHIPYRGSAPALQDLMAGQIDALNAPITTLVGQLRDGIPADAVHLDRGAHPGLPRRAQPRRARLWQRDAHAVDWAERAARPARLDRGADHGRGPGRRGPAGLAGAVGRIRLRPALPGADGRGVFAVRRRLPRPLGGHGARTGNRRQLSIRGHGE